MTSGLLPPGFRDRLPPAAQAQAALVRIIVDGFAAHGYERIQPPLVEDADSLAAWLARPVPRGLFRAADPATGAALAVRPDITGQVARIAATRLASAPRPLRLAYAGPVLRGRAGQLDPARELTQAGAEIIGTDSEPAIAELVAAAVEALATAGATSLSVDLTTPDLVADLAAGPWPTSDVQGLVAALDGKDWGALDRPDWRPYRALIELAGAAATALPRLAGIAPALAARLQTLVAMLPALRISIDPTERHGFEYQRWCGFSLFGAAGGQPLRAEIGRGGAYRVRHPDGHEEPAAGISLYVDPLADAGLGVTARPRLFLPLGTDAATAARLRAEGWATVAALAPGDRPAGCTHVWQDGAAVARG